MVMKVVTDYNSDAETDGPLDDDDSCCCSYHVTDTRVILMYGADVYRTDV